MSLIPHHQNIRIVLIHTSHPGNIGAVARAMLNMGLSELVLVQPKEFPSERADWRAAGAKQLLDQARVMTSVEEAIADCALVVGTSARDRRIPWPLVNPRQCGERMLAEAARHPVAILFGREDRGLTNHELQKCNYHVHIPTNQAYSSLNLAMAVQVICYELRMAMETPSELNPAWDQPLADQQAMELFFEHLEQVMTRVNFHEPHNPRQTLPRLRRLFHRSRMDKMELGILRGFLVAIGKKITG
jgi:tRNA (cytidine32/uridine32-2'-O)-methyltransferase